MESDEESAKRTDKLKKKIPDCFFQIPIQALSAESKDKLKFLDCKFIVPDKSVKLRDYRGLACFLGYSMMEINELIDKKQYTSPTLLILDKMVSEKKSMGDLILCLLKLKRSDILANFKESCNNDVLTYLNKTNFLKIQTVNDEIFVEMTSKDKVNKAQRELGSLVTTDILKIDNKNKDMYDIFISFESESVEDIKIMWTISQHLEENGMTVAKGSYSFFQGCCLIDAFAQAIYERSKKVILLISQAYINSESCLMQLSFAKDSDRAAWRNRVIPVYLEKVQKPNSIANLNSFLYYDEYIRANFFKYFIKSVKDDL